MPTLIITGFLAFVLALIFTPVVRAAVNRLGGLRRRAPGGAPAVPRLGGVAVMAAAALGLGLRAWFHWGLPNQGDSALLTQLTPPLLLILALGAADDCLDLSPKLKFSWQFVAAAWVTVHGLRVSKLFYHTLPNWLSVAITLLWLVGCTNAFNLIDGLDGLATGMALFATGTVLAHAVLIGEPGLALVMGVLFGALLGFLVFNFPPASIYLGDAGSLSIGFLLGCMALAWANKATTAVGLLAPLFAMLVPMADTGLAILRRGLTGQPLFGGDQSHIHHRLLKRGLAPRQAVLVLYLVAGLGGVLSLVLADLQQRHSFEMVILLFALLAALGIHQLGFTEFAAVGRLVRQGGFDPRRTLQAQAALRQWAEEIGHAPDFATLCEGLSAVGQALQFDGVRFQAAPGVAPGWDFERHWGGNPGQFGGWTCQIPLGENGSAGRVTFWRGLSPPQSGFPDDLAGVLETAFTPRLRRLRAEATPSQAAGASGGA